MIRSSAKYVLLSALLLMLSVATGQNMSVNGRFNTRYFSVDDFGSSAQIWAGAQGADGSVYFGNRQDILVYNGIEWKKIKPGIREDKGKNGGKLITETKVREIFRASDDVLYVGRENNFGYIAYSDSGAPCYYPLYAETGSKAPGNVWNIFELNNQKMLFVAENGLYTVQHKKVTQLTIPTAFKGYISRTSSRFGNGILIVYQRENAGKRQLKYLFLDLLSGRLQELTLPEHIELRNIRGSFRIDQNWYLLDITGRFFRARQENGHFTWNAANEVIFPEMQHSDPNFIQRTGDHLFMGTETDGVLIADLTGKVIRRIDFYDGLENLNVFKLFHDNEGNLWLCLDNGLQVFETSSPITYFKKDEGITSLPEAIVFDRKQEMLVGLHTDIFTPAVRNTHKYFVSRNVLHQDVFDLETYETSQGEKTLVIGYNGIYEYLPASNTSRPISPSYAFTLCPDPDNKDVVYATLEAGIAKLTLQSNGTWKYEELKNDVGGETFSLVVYKGKIYFGITEKGLGIYTIATGKLSVVEEPNRKKAESSSYYVEQFQGEIFVETTNGIAILSPDEKRLNLFPQNKEFFGTSRNDFHRMVNINDEQLWLVIYRDLGEGKFEIETGWLEKHRNGWEWVKWPLAGLQKAGIISSIKNGPDNEVWLGASNGLFVLNFDAVHKYHHQLTVSIDRFEAGGKTIRYNVFKALPMDPLNYSQNSFRVTFHANSFSGMDHTEYRYKLEGFNDEWSEWSNQYYKDFQKIGEGTYTLMIQARNGFGIESTVLSYEITILPPWYRTIWAFVLYVIALIVLIFVIVQLSTQRVKRQNQRLEETVQERTREIAEQNTQLERQKAEITQKTTDILDSIQYAKRIQNTILPASTRLNELFDEHFVFYRPKDIVSGDFYWAREVQGKTIFSAIDCTGHGVPGSLVSIVGNNGLIRAVNEFKLTEPGEILDKLREIVVSAFRSEGQQDVKDGMDIALCSIDYETGILKYAGANNECVIIRNGEVVELKPDKQPIGQFVDAKPFHQQEFQLEDNDCIYLYTDGYVDQFGGDKAKKFKSRPFKTMLNSMAHLTMSQQFVAVQQAFDTWKGDLEQVDDVCVFGVRYKKR